MDKNYAPLRNAKITIVNKTSLTDDRGSYYLDDIPIGSHHLKVTYNGKEEAFSVIIKEDLITTFDPIVSSTRWPTRFKTKDGFLTELVPLNGQANYVSPSADGTSLAVEVFGDNTRGSEIWILDLKTKQHQIIKDVGSYFRNADLPIGYRNNTKPVNKNVWVSEGNPQWLPDGHRIVFQTNLYNAEEKSREKFSLWLLDPTTEKAKYLGFGFTPHVSKNRERLLYSKVSTDIKYQDIYFLALDDGVRMQPIRLTQEKSNQQYPSFGKVGGKEFIYFSAKKNDEAFEIWRMETDGTNATQLNTIPRDGSEAGVDAFGPLLHPSGKHLLFWSRDNRVWIAGPNGENARVLIDRGHNPVWSPDEKYLYYIGRHSWTSQVWRISYSEISTL